ncbi:MAG: rhomboid family intramembrane serine protease [Labilithrix sp.]|nr:rhomboid family intramembrane serine protease [Labilithrix sp.]
MLPISDENPTLRPPVVTVALLVTLGTVWVFVQHAGIDEVALARSICDWGLVPAEITGRAKAGATVPITRDLACLVETTSQSWLTPVTSMFLHGGWAHIIGNALFLWVFGNNVEDSMGRIRYVVFYVVCGLAAAALQVVLQPSATAPMVGASGAISGVLGAYLVLYPRVRVKVLVPLPFFWTIMTVPAYVMLLVWIGLQVVAGLPQLLSAEVSSGGVAVFAHIGGFIAGVALVKPFHSRRRVSERNVIRHRHHPGHA